MLSVLMLSVTFYFFIMLNVVMLNVIMLSVVAPTLKLIGSIRKWRSKFKCCEYGPWYLIAKLFCF
jgi:hypothetical protein